MSSSGLIKAVDVAAVNKEVDLSYFLLLKFFSEKFCYGFSDSFFPATHQKRE